MPPFVVRISFLREGGAIIIAIFSGFHSGKVQNFWSGKNDPGGPILLCGNFGPGNLAKTGPVN